MSARTAGVSVAVGLPAAFRTLTTAGNDTIGGAPPSRVLIFPAGRWVLADGELVTDAESLRQIVRHFSGRGIRVVFDYEHMTLDEYRKPGELPIAAGWITALEITPEGLVGSVAWTDKAASMIAAGEYAYHSPVAIFDKTTRRVIALHSCALTNTPRTNDQKPITEQLAAKIIAACIGNETEVSRVQWIDLLMQFLSGRFDSTPQQKADMLRALIDALEAVGNVADAAAIASEDTGSILSHLGLVRATEHPTAADIVASLGLAADAELPAIVARIAEMKTGVIARADHDREVAALRGDLQSARENAASLAARLESISREGRIESAITANLERLSPALRENIRAVAKTDGELALQMIANITGTASGANVSLPAPIAGADPVVAAAATEERLTWRGEVLDVSETSGSIAAAVRQIQKTDGCDYEEATRRYHKRTTAA